MNWPLINPSHDNKPKKISITGSFAYQTIKSSIDSHNIDSTYDNKSYINIPSAILDAFDSTPYLKCCSRLWRYIRRLADHSTNQITASIASIAEKLNLCTGTVQRDINRLVEKGWLKIMHNRTKTGNQLASTYILQVPTQIAQQLAQQQDRSTYQQKAQECIDYIPYAPIFTNQYDQEPNKSYIYSTCTETSTDQNLTRLTDLDVINIISINNNTSDLSKPTEPSKPTYDSLVASLVSCLKNEHTEIPDPNPVQNEEQIQVQIGHLKADILPKQQELTNLEAELSSLTTKKTQIESYRDDKSAKMSQCTGRDRIVAWKAFGEAEQSIVNLDIRINNKTHDIKNLRAIISTKLTTLDSLSSLVLEQHNSHAKIVPTLQEKEVVIKETESPSADNVETEGIAKSIVAQLMLISRKTGSTLDRLYAGFRKGLESKSLRYRKIDNKLLDNEDRAKIILSKMHKGEWRF